MFRSASSNDRLRIPKTARNGCGSNGNLCIGGRPDAATTALGEWSAIDPSSNFRLRRHCRIVVSPVTSFTPTDTMTKSAECSGIFGTSSVNTFFEL
ncbi:MAG: hypothetical protein AAFN50_08145 [Pseudomonadota bacterium]